MSKKFIAAILAVAILLPVSIIVITNLVSEDSTAENKTDTNDVIKNYQVPEKNPELDPDGYDVVVVGGEPEGVAAAVSAARNGAKTLLIEEREGLGGLMTFGMLNFIDMVQGPDGNSAVEGIFKEWHELVGGDSAFDVELAKAAFLKLVQDEENLTLMTNTTVEDVMLDNQTVTGLEVTDHESSQKVSGKRLIDATQDADIAVMAGAPYYTGGEDINLKDRLMAVTLMIHLYDVDWAGVRQAVEEETFGYAAMTDSVAWGFSELHYEYETKEENTRLRGLNLARVIGEEREEFYINALQLFGVDGLNDQELEDAIEKGKRETDHIVEYLRKELPGFENAKVASYPEELYVRETRHVKTEYILPMSDIWTNRDHWDGIGMGGYPVDIQATSLNDYGTVVSSPDQFAIPFRSTVPLDIENMLVVSRSAGYSSIAAGSARIIPTGMAVGEAGGAAAIQSIDNDMTFRELSGNQEQISQLRETLQSQGALVDSFDLSYPYEGEWFDEAVQHLIDYAIVAGGYDNDLKVDDDLSAQHFIRLLSNGAERAGDGVDQTTLDLLTKVQSLEDYDAEEVLSKDKAAKYIVLAFAGEEVSEEASFEAVQQRGLIDEVLLEKLGDKETLSRAEGYYWSSYLIRTQIQE